MQHDAVHELDGGRAHDDVHELHYVYILVRTETVHPLPRHLPPVCVGQGVVLNCSRAHAVALQHPNGMFPRYFVEDTSSSLCPCRLLASSSATQSSTQSR
eukprot:m.886032 g.886032  ORF g.886032 m.886032 type:complete len:100 (-) comp23623_c1_seq8:2103-2402(-)